MIFHLPTTLTTVTLSNLVLTLIEVQATQVPPIYFSGNWGTPAAINNPSNIRSPRSSPNAWVTNLDGNFLVGTREALKMPVFDKFDTVFKAELRFWQNIDFGQSVGASSYHVAGSILYRYQGNFEVLGGTVPVSDILG